MTAEGKDYELKREFEADNPRSKLGLVKDLVAMANSGGGQIVFGRDETSAPGLDLSSAERLDSARIADLVEKYTEKGCVSLSHEIEVLPSGKAIVVLSVDSAPYPVVFQKDGDWPDRQKGEQLAFRSGEVLMRHSSKTERLSQQDMRSFLNDAYEKGINRVLAAAQVVREAGPSTSVEIRPGGPDTIRSPGDLLSLALSRRAHGLPYLLSGRELLWLFVRKHELGLSEDHLELVIESALRRPPTLYWWLLDRRADSLLVNRVLSRVPDSEDRDKSDAAASAVELASLYLNEQDADGLMARLKRSKYSHFRSAARKYVDRERAVKRLESRVGKAVIGDHSLETLTDQELEAVSETVASQELRSATRGRPRKLGDILRALWLKRVYPSLQE